MILSALFSISMRNLKSNTYCILNLNNSSKKKKKIKCGRFHYVFKFIIIIYSEKRWGARNELVIVA